MNEMSSTSMNSGDASFVYYRAKKVTMDQRGISINPPKKMVIEIAWNLLDEVSW